MEDAEKKKRKRQRQHVVLKEAESQSVLELVEVLESLEKDGKSIDIKVCPKCKSPKIRRVGSMNGDLWGHMGILPSKFECKECGWATRMTLKATNRPLSIKDISVIAEALSSEKRKDMRESSFRTC